MSQYLSSMSHFKFIFSLLLIIPFLMVIIKLFKRIKTLSRELEIYKNKALQSEETDLLSKILKVTFKKESINKSTSKIRDVIIDHFDIDYCTLYTASSRNRLDVVTTNVPKAFTSYLEVAANGFLNSLSEDELGKVNFSEYVLDYPSAKERNIKYMYFIPLLIDDDLVGAILLENRSVETLNNLETDFFKIVIRNISILLQNFIYYDQLVTSSMTDGLTKVKNRFCMEKELSTQIEQHSASNSKFVLTVLDIDKFKNFNDTCGHLMGDLVLKEVSQFIKKNLRPEDEIYRYGGEEFVIVWDKTDGNQIFERLNSIREGLSNHIVEDENGTKVSVTASFGMSEYPTHSNSINGLIATADKAMYYAKEHGRNKVTLYNSSMEQIDEKIG